MIDHAVNKPIYDDFDLDNGRQQKFLLSEYLPPVQDHHQFNEDASEWGNGDGNIDPYNDNATIHNIYQPRLT